MRDTTSKQNQKEAVQELTITLPAVVATSLQELVHTVGMHALKALLKAEQTALCGPRYPHDPLQIFLDGALRDKTALCGPRYPHDPQRAANRHGSTPGELVLGGRRVRVRKPRVRSVDGQELKLPTWEQFSNEDPLDVRATEQMLVGVSTRKYARSLEPLPEDIDAFGTSKSAVSRRFVRQTSAQVEEFLQRRLDSLKLCVLMLDGVHVAEHVLLVAVGIDEQGHKHVLGMREGASENAVSRRELLCDLRERGMQTELSLLVVLDGSKALSKAVREVFGERALIQRCRVHKERNVTEQIPKELVPSVRQTMRQAYASRDAVRATKQLENLAHSLEVEHPGAAASLREGLSETLTVMRLPDELVRHLSSTNLIENLIGSVRKLSARVQNWRDGQMALRWTCATAMDAAKRFRRLKGYRGLPSLIKALRDHDHHLGLAPDTQAA